MAVNVTAIQVNEGTAVMVVASFTVPTTASYPTITQKPQAPAAVKFQWRWAGGTVTTWTYAKAGTTHITKLASPHTNVFVATISTKTATTTTLSGLVVGTGTCTATGEFAIQVVPVAA